MSHAIKCLKALGLSVVVTACGVSGGPSLIEPGSSTGESNGPTPASTYAVTYNDNGSTSGIVPIDLSSPYATTSSVTVLNNTVGLVKSGQVFLKWNSDPTGAGVDYLPGQTFAMNVTPVTLYAQWASPSASVDGGGTNGLNKDPGTNGRYPNTVTFNGKLYATWYESVGAVTQVRASVFNGSLTSPGWSFVDGGGTYGLNKNTAKSASTGRALVHNSKLYYVWIELFGTITQVRVAVYNGDDSAPQWTFVDGNNSAGLNFNSSKGALDLSSVVANGKLYLTWREQHPTMSAFQTRIAVYNDNDGAPAWAFVDGNGPNGINKDPTKNVSGPSVAVFNNKVFATWSEAGAAAAQIRVAVYNGNDSAPAWNFVDGNSAIGVNVDSTKNASNPKLNQFNAKLYATWTETNGTNTQIRLAVYGGDDLLPTWTMLDGGGATGLNHDVARDANLPYLHAHHGQMFLTWYESSSSSPGQIRLSVYNGNNASPLMTSADGNGPGGVNVDVNNFAIEPNMATLNDGLFLIWSERNSGSINQIRVKTYNGY